MATDSPIHSAIETAHPSGMTMEGIQHLLSCGECQDLNPVLYQLIQDSSEAVDGFDSNPPQYEYDEETGEPIEPE